MPTNYHQEFIEDVVYHIYNRSVIGVDLFANDEEYSNFLLKFNKYLGFFFDKYAHCLIPNHFHFLVKVKCVSEIDFLHFQKSSTLAFVQFKRNEISLNGLIEDQFRRLFSSVALSYNHRYKRRGSLFDGRFKRVSVKSETRILYLLCYIHHNPIHHGLTKTYDKWTHSSYHNFNDNTWSLPCYSYLKETLQNHFMDDYPLAFSKLHNQFKIDPDDFLNID